MSAVINLHPACTHTPAAVYAVEMATGLVAIRFRGRLAVVLVKPTANLEVA